MKHLSYFLAFSILVACSPSEMKKNDNDPIAEKVEALLAQMTLAEKVGQTNMYNGTWEFTGPVPADNNSQEKAENIRQGRVGALLNVLTAEGTRQAQKLAVENSRLGIPLIFGYDVIHGYKTMLPVPLAQAASWDAEAARLGAEVAARESAASGIHWTFAPMIDISRDGRWGRIMEGAGEDPFLTSVMAKAWVKGFQGDDLSDPLTIAACAKHFAAYGLAEGGRDYNSVDISISTLHNVVLPPFKAAADAGVATFMNAFNDISGVPATGSALLQRDILKGAWNYPGLVVSDWGSIGEMITHGYAADRRDAALKALQAGSDMDMESRAYEYELEQLVTEGKLDVKLLDDAVRRILTLKFQMGLFDDPYKYCNPEQEKSELLSQKNLEAAREVARKSMVLLKNENSLLPLAKDLKSIAVIGQLAASKDVPLGNWRAQAITDSGVSLLEGVQNAVGAQTKVEFAQGYTLTTGRRTFVHELNMVESDESGFAAALALAKKSEVVILALGEDCFQTGEGRSQADITLKGSQEKLFHELIKVNPRVVVVLMNGRPLAIPAVAEKAPAILEAWFGGSEAGNATADVLFGDFAPEGKLPVSFPYTTGQEPLYYNKMNTGRPITNPHDDGLVFWSHYTDSPTEALFPFGHGLSYTTFRYSDLAVEKTATGFKVACTVTNTGSRVGTEVVQLYMRDLVASLARPIRELKGFQKVKLEPGQSQVVRFELSQEALSFYNNEGQLLLEHGDFQIWVGGSSRADLSAVARW